MRGGDKSPRICRKPHQSKWSVRGGLWTASHAGVPFDSYRAAAVGQGANDFCLAFSLPRTATFALSKFGARAAAILAD